MMEPTQTVAAVAPPGAPVLVAGAARAAWLTPDGEVLDLRLEEAALKARETPPMLVHAPATARRLGVDRFASIDLLELWAFVRPAQFCLPTPRGLSRALDLGEPDSLADQALAAVGCAERLLAELADPERRSEPDLLGLARVMARGGWRWGPAVLAALGDAPGAFVNATSGAALEAWRRLPEWSEHAPEPPPGHQPIAPAEARQRLDALLARSRGAPAEPRPQQADYASAVTHAFTPRHVVDVPRLVLAEAGTGVGKTLGYLAPATLWAERNRGPVWVSTFTRNLQHQIDRELDRLYPDASEKTRKVVIRKGRENYLCLLNFAEAAAGLTSRPQDAVPLGLMARWARATRDGDMVGGDFPAWLADLVGRGRTRGLADRRGECVYSACEHFHKCFIERSVRRARRADIVIANHALVMVQAALGGIDDANLPTRYVFDEGHHVFGAADGAFSGMLSGDSATELRRWLLGPEGGKSRSRARGLKRRCEDLVEDDAEAQTALQSALVAARALPGDGWMQRAAGGNPVGPTEAFLALVRDQVHARAKATDDSYTIETETRPPIPGLVPAAERLEGALGRLAEPLIVLSRRLAEKLDREAGTLDSNTRIRIEAVCRSVDRRVQSELLGWRGMLAALQAETPEEFVDWFSVERIEGREIDVAFHRHWIDPTIPFAERVAKPAQGLLVTSATLTDGTGEVEHDWRVAEARTGARHLRDPVRASVPSPFDYPAQTRVLIVRDVSRDDMDQIAAAYRALFLAAGGGALGLFTAIGRLKAVHARLAHPLEEAGLPLYAQHVDGLDTGTLIDIFRAETNACLLGTDAVRDGVDVPGRSLRLIVFDRVPWPRPDILHKARKAAFGGTAYDDMITRLRLKQAFGRLIRRADDVGVFVLLDPRLPTRLTGAFPPGVEVRRTGLAEAVETTREFLATHAAPTAETRR